MASNPLRLVPEVGSEGAVNVVLEPAELIEIGRLVALGQLVPRLVHEVSNPLSGIVGLAELLQHELEAGTRAQHRLQLIERSGLELREILRALRSLASKDIGELAVVSLARIASETVELVRLTNAGGAVELLLAEPVDEGLVYARPGHLRQLLAALLADAVRAVSEGGTILITVEREGGQLALSVADTRLGGPAEGGMPLLAAERIASLYGGELVRRPRPGGGGSLVSVLLPAA